MLNKKREAKIQTSQNIIKHKKSKLNLKKWKLLVLLGIHITGQASNLGDLKMISFQ